MRPLRCLRFNSLCMKILQISSAKNFGGGEKHLIDLCRGLSEKNHEIFVALRKESVWQNKLAFLQNENIFQVPLRNSIDIFSARNLAKLMRDNDIDILHAHLARDYPIAGLAARLYPKVKLILTRHVLFQMKSLHKITLQNVARAIAVSTAVKSNLQNIFPADKIVCIPNGIEIEKFAKVDRQKLSAEFRTSHEILPDKKLIGSIGELKQLKGQEDFILAANEIAKKISDAHFILVGKDNTYDKSFRRKLKRLVKVFDLEDKFTFLDWLEDTAPLLSALDVFVSPSHSESFGLAILEAMASGTAIVSTATEGAKELIVDDFTGKLVPIKKPVELAKIVCEVLEDSERRDLFGQNAREFARENYSLSKMISKTEELYESTIS